MDPTNNWFDNWLEGLPDEDLRCVRGKSPDSEKMKYCRKTERGSGCPNLVPAIALLAKEGTVFGKRANPEEGLNTICSPSCERCE